MQAFHDVSAGEAVCRCRQGNARHAHIALVQHGKRVVFGAEVMAPLAHAVGFVNRKQAQLPVGMQIVQQPQKARRDQTLRRHIQQRELAALHLPFHILRIFPAERGVEESSFDPCLMQRADLVVHEGNQGETTMVTP